MTYGRGVYDRLVALGHGFHPSSCHWEVTSRCNASCAYCFIRDNEGADLPTDAMLGIVDRLADEGIMTLTISGGEPFLRDDICRIIERAIARDFFVLNIYTNGTRFPAEAVDLLTANAAAIEMVKLSAFSHVPAINDEYFGIDGALARIVESGEKLANGGVKVVVTLNVMPYNLAGITDTVKFFRDRGMGTSVEFHKLVSRPSPARIPESYYSVEFFCECLERIPRHIWDKDLERMKECLCRGSDKKELCIGRCTSLMIDAQGGLHPCVTLRGIHLGSVLSAEPLHRQLASREEYRSIREMDLGAIPECMACPYRGFCAVCVGGNLLENGDPVTPRKQACNMAEAFARVARRELGDQR